MYPPKHVWLHLTIQILHNFATHLNVHSPALHYQSCSFKQFFLKVTPKEKVKGVYIQATGWPLLSTYMASRMSMGNHMWTESVLCEVQDNICCVCVCGVDPSSFNHCVLNGKPVLIRWSTKLLCSINVKEILLKIFLLSKTIFIYSYSHPCTWMICCMSGDKK